MGPWFPPLGSCRSRLRPEFSQAQQVEGRATPMLLIAKLWLALHTVLEHPIRIAEARHGIVDVGGVGKLAQGDPVLSQRFSFA